MSVAPSSTSKAVAWVPCRGWFSGEPHDGPAWIGVADGRISAISATRPQRGDVVRDGAALYAAPLLADAHVHVYMQPWPIDPARRVPPGSKPFEDEVEDAIARVDAALASGVGLLRDFGDPLGINIEVKRRLAHRGTPAPKMLVCGPGFHRPKKYGRFIGVARETIADICASIDELHRRGQIDFVKLVTTGIVDFANRRVTQSPQFTVEELSRVVGHAHELGYKVASHCSGEDGIDINLAAGVDFLEHGYFIREGQIDRMIEKRIAWTPTLAPVYVQGIHDEATWAPEVRRNIDSILRDHAARIAYAIRRGATVLVGTDAGSPGVEMGCGMRIELERLAAAGMAADELLRMATVGNAAAIGYEAYAPALQVGAAASFALYEHCPWRDIRNLNSLRHLFIAGERVNSPSPIPMGEGRGEGSSTSGSCAQSVKNPHPSPLPEYREREIGSNK